MKNSFILLLILLSFTNAVTLNGTVANATYIITLVNNTFYLNDTNATFKINLNNSIINASYQQTITTLDNTTWVTPANVTVVCPVNTCFRNISQTISYPNSFIDAITNTTILTTPCYVNITKHFTFGENYVNLPYGIFMYSPVLPAAKKYDLNWTPGFGEKRTNDELNITCNAPKVEGINRNDTLTPNQSVFYPVYNYSANALGCSEGYNFVPPILNCSTNKSFTLNNNKTVNYCVDNIRNLCTDTELLDGNILGCITRFNYDLNFTRSELDKKYVGCSNDLQNASNIINGFTAMNNAQRQSMEFWMTALLGVGVAVGVSGFVQMMWKKQTKE